MASIWASKPAMTMASSSGPMVVQRIVRKEMPRPDWNANRPKTRSKA